LNDDEKTALKGGHFHAVRFYDTKESLCRIVAEFLGEGFVTGQPALVIATPEHGDGVVAELRARHFDTDKMQAAGDLLVLDAREVLSTFMEDGHPDSVRFNVSVPEAIARLLAGRPNRTVRAYGEMVDLLWKDGLTTAAVRLEMLWNQLARTHDFSLLCGYSMGNFYKDAAVEDICAQHSHVVSSEGIAAAASSGLNKPGPTVH
jgi:hypothetical protein